MAKTKQAPWNRAWSTNLVDWDTWMRGGPPSIKHPRNGVQSASDLLSTPEWKGSKVEYHEHGTHYKAHITHPSGAQAFIPITNEEWLSARDPERNPLFLVAQQDPAKRDRLSWCVPVAA